LLVAPGNPKAIHSLDDLRKPSVNLINRNRGSGTRLWLDRQLGALSIPIDELHGYSRDVRTHTEVAEAISQGKADVGLGLFAAALQFNLDFIPLFEERFDLALPTEQVEDASLRPFLDFLQTAAFRRLVTGLGGYNPNHSGDWLEP
jgi:putative molybdopterin biosynthesis protein